jgi:hypothetical protein
LIDEEQAPLAAHPQSVDKTSGSEDLQGLPNTLFDFAQPTVDTERSSRRSRTALSGNPLITVVNQTGVFDMEVLYCICPNAGARDEQLLQSGLFPASFKQIETAFTFSVLDDFLTDNLECKTTAQQYYSKLQSITNRMFPGHVPVCLIAVQNHFPCADDHIQNLYKQLLRASRQWRDLKNRMQSGLGHQQETGSPPDGYMAIFCPACPQPGINLPEDWQERYNLYVFIETC